jgi:hypothetical protein
MLYFYKIIIILTILIFYKFHLSKQKDETLVINDTYPVLEHFHTLFTPFYISKDERRNTKLENIFGKKYRDLFKKRGNNDFITKLITFGSTNMFSHEFKKKLLIEITTQSQILNLKNKIFETEKEIFENLKSEKINIGVVSDFRNLKKMEMYDDIHFISTLPDKYLFAITARCTGIINFTGITCRTVGIEHKDIDLWNKVISVFNLDVKLHIFEPNKTKYEIMIEMDKGIVDVFFYCDYFPNTFISEILKGSVSNKEKHKSIYKDNILIQYPTIDEFKEGVAKFSKYDYCSFIPKTLSINETKPDMIGNPERYNMYYFFNDNAFWYKSYKFNEILVCNVKLPEQISYELSKIIFERLAMRRIDKLIPNENVKIQIHKGTQIFIDEVMRNKQLKDFEIDYNDDNYENDNPGSLH